MDMRMSERSCDLHGRAPVWTDLQPVWTDSRPAWTDLRPPRIFASHLPITDFVFPTTSPGPQAACMKIRKAFRGSPVHMYGDAMARLASHLPTTASFPTALPGTQAAYTNVRKAYRDSLAPPAHTYCITLTDEVATMQIMHYLSGSPQGEAIQGTAAGVIADMPEA
ncbi:hypothetical protein JB92DRAFT_3149598 [Gautieria morchelliformis]|nr:hypothetical protein JB92DRAFT_3149598 [Gautieria morchelliformis]